MDSSSLKVSELILRLGLVAQCWGLYGIALSKNTALNGVFFLSLDLSEPLAKLIDQGGATLAMTAAMAALWWPRTWMLGLISAWMMLVALASWHQGGAPFSQWSVLAWSIRWGAPLALLCWMRWPKAPERGEWLARGVIASTFALHGVEALSLHPAFVDLIIGAGHRFFGVWWAQSTVHLMLRVIGAVDLIVAALLLSGKRWTKLAMYLALWGFVTALSRVVEWGPSGWAEASLRACHGALPLALWWRWRKIKSKTTTSQSDEGADEPI